MSYLRELTKINWKQLIGISIEIFICFSRHLHECLCHNMSSNKLSSKRLLRRCGSIAAFTYYFLSVVQCGHGRMVWRVFVNSHRHFVKGGPPWRHYRLQWCVYVAEFWPSAIFRHPPLITLLLSMFYLVEE